MPKYCGYCGKPIEGDVKACGNCGASLKDMPSGQLKNRKKKDIVQLVTVAVLLLIAVILVINIVSGFVGAKGTARKVMNAYIDNDVDTLLNIASDYYYIQTDLNGISIGTYFENQLDAFMERYEGYMGEDYKVTYKIIDSYDLNDYRATKIYDKMTALDDYDMEKVSKIAAVEVEVEIQGESLSFTEPWKLIIVKESGQWRLFSLGLNNSDN